MAGFAEGLTSGFQTANNAYQQAQLGELRKQQQGLEQVNTLNNIMKLAQTDPGAASVVMGSWGKQMQIDPDTLKGYQDFLTKSNSQTIEYTRNALVKAGLSADPGDIMTAMKGGSANLFSHITQRQQSEIAGQQQGAMAEAGGSPPQTLNAATTAANPPPIVSQSQGNDGTSAAPVAPVSPPVAIVPPGMEGRAPVKSGGLLAMNGVSPDQGGSGLTGGQGAPAPVADTSGAPTAVSDTTVTPRMSNDTASALGGPHPEQMPGLPTGHASDGAQHAATDAPAMAAAGQYGRIMKAVNLLNSRGNTKAADGLLKQADEYAKRSTIIVPYNDPRVSDLHLPSGANVQLNLADPGQTKILTAGNETYSLKGPDDPRYGQLLKGQPPGSMVSVNDRTHETKVIQSGQQVIPLTKEERGQYGQEGNPLDPGTAYAKEAGSGRISAISTGLTADKANVAGQAGADIKELETQRAEAVKNQSVINQSKVITQLSDAVQTGKLAPIKIGVGQWATALNLDPKKYINVPAGEALDATLGKDILSQVGSFAKTSDAEDRILQKSAGTLTTTPQGIRLIRDLADFKAKNANKIVDLANNWDAANLPRGLSSKIPSDIQDPALQPYAGKTYYQAKREIDQAPELPQGIKDQIRNLDKVSDELSQVKDYRSNMGAINKEQARLLYKYQDRLSPAEQTRLEGISKANDW